MVLLGPRVSCPTFRAPNVELPRPYARRRQGQLLLQHYHGHGGPEGHQEVPCQVRDGDKTMEMDMNVHENALIGTILNSQLDVVLSLHTWKLLETII